MKSHEDSRGAKWQHQYQRHFWSPLICPSEQGVQQALRGGRHDAETFCEEDGALLNLVDVDQLPVPPGLEEADRHRRVGPLLLPQGLCLSPVLDRSQGSLHGCPGLLRSTDQQRFF